jgi:hypothetical protein
VRRLEQRGAVAFAVVISSRRAMAAPHVTQFLAATNKFLAPINKSRTGVKATKKRIRQKKRYRPHVATRSI